MEKIKVNIQRTINLGNYESFKIEVGEEIKACPTESDPFCEAQIKVMCDTMMAICKAKSKEYKKLLKPIKKL